MANEPVAKQPEEKDKEEDKKPFDEFMRTEYTNVAQAHFNTSQAISEFFKAYITVVSLPISAAVIFLKPKELKESGFMDFLFLHPLTAVVSLGAVALIGLLVLGYVVNLRCDALLYARTVNGIRRYFYELGSLDLETELRYRVLPKRTQTPQYWETWFFLFVVAAFAAVGTAYWATGLYFYHYALSRPFDWIFLGLVALCPALHLLVYWAVTRYRDRRYQKSRILGVDIDGVLNEHREHFCAILVERTGKELKAEAIVRVPVREIPGCGVDVHDESAVFNWPQYWTQMPVVAGAAEMVRRIRNELGYDIWIFTHRPWPHPEWYAPDRAYEYRMAWEGASWWSRYVLSAPARWVERVLGVRHIRELWGFRPIRSVTKAWLRREAIPHDKVIVERGNVEARDPLFFTKNRFVVSAKRELRAFVEDDPNKAKRLADVTEIVFLIDQPYNQDTPGLPRNVVRVKSWTEIYQYLRAKL
jgi:hypothetical protein